MRSSVEIKASITHTNDILLFVTSSAYHRVLKILDGFVIYSAPNGATAQIRTLLTTRDFLRSCNINYCR